MDFESDPVESDANLLKHGIDVQAAQPSGGILLCWKSRLAPAMNRVSWSSHAFTGGTGPAVIT
jgi:hypothetical protein